MKKRLFIILALASFLSLLPFAPASSFIGAPSSLSGCARDPACLGLLNSVPGGGAAAAVPSGIPLASQAGLGALALAGITWGLSRLDDASGSALDQAARNRTRPGGYYRAEAEGSHIRFGLPVTDARAVVRAFVVAPAAFSGSGSLSAPFRLCTTLPTGYSCDSLVAEDNISANYRGFLIPLRPGDPGYDPAHDPLLMPPANSPGTGTRPALTPDEVIPALTPHIIPSGEARPGERRNSPFYIPGFGLVPAGTPFPNLDGSPNPGEGTEPSPSPSPSPPGSGDGSPPGLAGTGITAAIAPTVFSDPNFVEYAKVKLIDNFPVDIWGTPPNAGDIGQCPSFSFWGKDFQICIILQALQVLRVPVVISFIMWAVMSI